MGWKHAHSHNQEEEKKKTYTSGNDHINNGKKKYL